MAKVDSQLPAIEKTAEKKTDGDKWGIPLKDLYRLGLGFFKGKHFSIMSCHCTFLNLNFISQTNPARPFSLVTRII